MSSDFASPTDGPTSPTAVRWQRPDLTSQERARALLAVMTLPEKIAQLGSAWPGQEQVAGNVAPMQDVFARGDIRFEQVRQHGLGHLTRPIGTNPVSAADGARRIAELQADIVDHTRLGVPAIVHEECLTGFTAYTATVYPTALAWAATFHPNLVQAMAHAIGQDMSALGVHQGLSPVLDVVRDYRWGRVEETLGEDPYLVATMGTAYVRGLEKAGIIATLKHFAGYSAARAARNHAPVTIGPREMADTILPPFEMAIRDGAARSVMNSYSDIDGVPAGAHAALLTGVLRGEWGFDGTVVSDYGSVAFLKTMHRIVGTFGQAGAVALAAGIDVELPDTLCYGQDLADLVSAGAVPEELIDRAALRVLQQKAELGLLDPDWASGAHLAAAGRLNLDSPRNRAIAKEIAEKSIVLLKNNHALPLPSGPAAPGTVAVIGPCADDPLAFMGCYSYPNHVLPHHPDLGMGIAAPSFYASLVAEIPSSTVTLNRGCPIREDDRSEIAAAAAAAADADIAIAVVGDRAGLFGAGTSGEGCDVPDLQLPGVQADLLDALLETDTPVIVLLVSGRPYSLGRYADRAAALVQAFMPGEEGGAALAGVLSGRVNPTGKLPVQIPRLPGGLPTTYLHPPLGGNSKGISNLDPTPLYGFGHGLSYTTYSYDHLELSATSIPTDGQLDATVTITNTGTRAGEEIVQLYLHDVEAQLTRPVLALTGYTRVALQPGESTSLKFTVHADRTAFTGIDLTRIVEPGQIELHIGASAADIRCSTTFTLTGPTRQVGFGRALTTPVTIAT